MEGQTTFLKAACRQWTSQKVQTLKQAWDFFIGGLASLNPFGVGLQPF
ncbi:MAG: hypothetical protein PWQ54_2163 [Bacteroidales bacterium]|nr:hypothetical protein [Bacteroidales bacterium]